MSTSQALQLGRLALTPFKGVAGWYNRIAQKSPLMTGLITTGLKTSAADAFAQKVRRVRRRRGGGGPPGVPAGLPVPARLLTCLVVCPAPPRRCHAAPSSHARPRPLAPVIR